MTIHDDARAAGVAASEAIYEAALSQLRTAAAEQSSIAEALREQLTRATKDRDRVSSELATATSELTAALTRIAELEAGTPTPVKRPLVSVYSGMEATADDQFVAGLGKALTSGTSYYTGSAYRSGVFNLVTLDKARVARGAALFVTYSASNGSPYTDWADVAEGKADAQFAALATALKGAPAGSAFTFANEPEVRVSQGNQRANGRNRPEDFAAAFRRTVEIMRPIAPNLDYRWWISGGKLDAEMERYYPGDAFVDSIGYDPYVWAHNPAGTTALQKYKPAVDWLRSRSWGKGKPIGLSETGFDVKKHGEAAAVTFWATVPKAVRDLDLRFVDFFDRGEWETTPSTTPLAWAAYVKAMKEISG